MQRAAKACPCQSSRAMRVMAAPVRGVPSIQHVRREARAVQVRASATMQEGGRRQLRLTLLQSLSKAVEAEGATAKFEVVAGRSACLGTSFALLIEGISGSSLLSGSGSTPSVPFEVLAGAAGCAVLFSSVAAVLRYQQTAALGAPLLEAVVTSLTAAKRSAASLTESQVDDAVDGALGRVFDAERLAELSMLSDRD